MAPSQARQRFALPGRVCFALRMGMRREQLRGFLVQTPFFGGLDDAAMERVVGALVERELAPGEIIYRQGEQGRAMYIVESGSVVLVCAGEHGHEVKLTGKGLGHGAGLCQIGAKVLADEGWDFKRILEHYYPGAVLQRMY